MKHARDDYSRIQDPAGIIPADEPVFLIRAQDTCAPVALKAWINHARGVGAPAEIITAAERQLVAMNDWQANHGRKIPDMDSSNDIITERLQASLFDDNKE